LGILPLVSSAKAVHGPTHHKDTNGLAIPLPLGIPYGNERHEEKFKKTKTWRLCALAAKKHKSPVKNHLKFTVSKMKIGEQCVTVSTYKLQHVDKST
jgi:hypothetical protein